MNPGNAKTMIDRRHKELIRTTAATRRNRNADPSGLSRHLPRWHVGSNRTVLSSAEKPAVAGSGTRTASGEGRVYPGDYHLGLT